MSNDRKIIEKIHNRIDSLAKKGRDHVFEYYKYIDELIDKGQYGYFEQVMSIYYNINIDVMIDVSDVKKKTWKPILFNTNPPFSSNLKKMYDSKNVYQVSNNIYTTSLTSSSVLLGQINEIDTYSTDAKYLQDNKDFAKAQGNRIIILEVSKVGVATASQISTNDTNLSSDQNLLNRYTSAVLYLLS